MKKNIKISIKSILASGMFILQVLCYAIVGCANLGAQEYVKGECKGSYVPAQDTLTACPTGQFENERYLGTKCPDAVTIEPQVPTCVAMASPPCITLCYIKIQPFPCHKKEWIQIDGGTLWNGMQYVVCKCEKSHPNKDLKTCTP